MASADVEKLAVFDSRIVQTRPKFAVEKGALSVTNAPFQALSQSTSQHTYSVQVPSETTFVDRAVNWTAQVGVAITFTLPALSLTGTTPAVLTFGRATTTTQAVGYASQGAPWGWAAFPLQSLTSTIQATINDTNVTINTSDVLKEVLRLVDIRKNTLVRQSPTKLDTLASAVADAGYVNGTYGAYINNAVVQEEVPNSASWISAATPASAVSPYVSSSGAALTQSMLGVALGGSYYAFTGTASAGSISNSVVIAADGSITLTITPTATATIAAGATLTLYVAPTFTEKLVLSPFVFSDVHERDTGLFGIQNIQFVMNMRNPADCRLIRQREAQFLLSGATSGGNAYGAYSITSAYASSMFTSGAFSGSRLDLLFLTPSLDLPLPPKSVVPYMEFPRYISTNNTSLGAASSQVYSTQTITLPQIPDYLVVYAKPSSYADATQGDWYLPISNVSIQWDNYAGLMSTHTQQQLYELSVENGLLQDYQQWSGRVSSPGAVYQNGLVASSTSGFAQAVGGMLVIKPGKDYALQVGQAPSLVGNYTLQLNVTLNNYSGAAVTPVIYVMTINSGFFESVKGTSRVVKGILSEADIIEAPLAPEPTTAGVARAVGGQGILKRMGHSIMKALPHVPAVLKAVAPVIKPHLPQAAQAAMSALGAAQPSRTGGRKSVHARLME